MIREDIYNSFPNININGGEVYDVDIIGDFTVKYKALILIILLIVLIGIVQK